MSGESCSWQEQLAWAEAGWKDWSGRSWSWDAKDSRLAGPEGHVQPKATVRFQSSSQNCFYEASSSEEDIGVTGVASAQSGEAAQDNPAGVARAAPPRRTLPPEAYLETWRWTTDKHGNRWYRKRGEGSPEGGSNCEVGSRYERNQRKKERRLRRWDRQEAEDAEDPDGAAAREHARRLRAAEEETKHRLRQASMRVWRELHADEKTGDEEKTVHEEK
jgi:hypothetical protein